MRAAILLLACLVLPPLALLPWTGTAWSQPAPPPAAAPPASPASPPGGPPGPESRRAELDRLLERLAQAPDETAAAALEARIRMLWAQDASPAVLLLLRRGQRNLEAEAAADAVEDFDAALTLQPGHAEAWLMRARALSALGDNAAAAADLRQVLVLEPRHFGALLALSGLQQQGGDLPSALRSLEAAMALHPFLPGADARLRELRRKVRGEET
jgi:tetratricopeptide (TPR) repeat protein